MKFKETQILKCPSDRSFDDHFHVWDEIQKIANKNRCSFKWKVLSTKERTFELIVEGASKQDHLNGIINLIKFLDSKDIEPAVIIKQKNMLKNKHIEQAINIIEEELYGTTA